MAGNSRGPLAAKIILGLVFLGAAWTLIASVVFLAGTHLYGSFAHPFYQWWTYFLSAPPNPVVSRWLKIGAGVASAVLVVFAAALVFRRRTIGPSLRPPVFGGAQEPIRGATDNHGHADWLSIAKAQEIFAGPSAEFGGIVVGEGVPGGSGQGCRCHLRSSQQEHLGPGWQGPHACRCVPVRTDA